MELNTPPTSVDEAISPALSRRGFLRAGALAGGGIAAVALAACAPAAGAPTWSFPAAPLPAAAGPSPTATASAEPSHEPSHAPAASASPAMDHDANAAAAVKRFLDGEATTLPLGNQPLEPRIEGDTKVFELTIDEIEHRIDALTDPVKALGYNGDLARAASGRHRGRQGPRDLHEQAP